MSKYVIAFALLAMLGISYPAKGMDDNSKTFTAWEYALQDGTVRICNFGAIKLHAYQTNNAMADECFILETADNLIAIESPCFENNIAEWQRYVSSLNKPLTDILLSYHPAGGKWYRNAASHATQVAQDAMTNGPTHALIGNLKKAFGDGFSADVPAIDAILPEGATTIGGVEFIVSNDGDGYSIVIPALHAVYIHMLGANVHSILASPEHIDASIAQLQGFIADKYALVISSHHTPETLADVEAKIAYLEKTKDIAAASLDKAVFIRAMKTEFPEYAGENYLAMTADNLFPDNVNRVYSKAEREILGRIELYLASINNAQDISVAESLWLTTPEATFIHPRGHEHGWDSIRANFYQGVMADNFSKRSLNIEGRPAIFMYGNVAVVEFNWDFTATRRSDGTIRNTKGRETQILVRNNGKEWRLAHVHYSAPATPPAQ